MMWKRGIYRHVLTSVIDAHLLPLSMNQYVLGLSVWQSQFSHMVCDVSRLSLLCET